MDVVTEKLQQTLETLISTGFELPIRFALIAANGVILAGHFELSTTRGAVDTRFVAKHYPGDGTMTAPINIMFTDRRGAATRICIETKAAGSPSIQ